MDTVACLRALAGTTSGEGTARSSFTAGYFVHSPRIAFQKSVPPLIRDESISADPPKLLRRASTINGIRFGEGW